MSRAIPGLAILAALAATGSLPAQGAIEGVTVFEDRARVVRAVPAEVAAGANRIQVPDLPFALDPGSVLAEIDVAGATVLGVRLERTVHERDIREEVRVLEEEARALAAAERTAGHAIEAAEKERALVERFATHLRQALLERSTGLPEGESETLLAAETTLSERAIAAEVRLDDLDRELREIRRRSQEVGENLMRLRAGARRVTITASVQVESTAAGAGTLRIGYDVDSSYWTPVYEARLDESAGSVALAYGAEVVQRSGEDWNGVALTLSTQRSSLGAAPPLLVPVRVSGHSVEKREAEVADRAASGSVAPPGSPAKSGGEAPAEDLSLAGIEGAGDVVRFRIPAAATIPADGRPHRVPILETAIPAALAFECTPRLSPHTFRRAELVNPTEAPFLPGVARVYRGSAYVGTALIRSPAPTIDRAAAEIGFEPAARSVPPGGRFRLGFGVEGRISVHRAETADRSRATGTFRRGERRTLGWTISARSELAEPAEVVIIDRVPVSEIEGVEVELTKKSTPRPEIDADGIARWRLILAPGEQESVLFEYQVTAPEGFDIPLEQLE